MQCASCCFCWIDWRAFLGKAPEVGRFQITQTDVQWTSGWLESASLPYAAWFAKLSSASQLSGRLLDDRWGIPDYQTLIWIARRPNDTIVNSRLIDVKMQETFRIGSSDFSNDPLPKSFAVQSKNFIKISDCACLKLECIHPLPLWAHHHYCHRWRLSDITVYIPTWNFQEFESAKFEFEQTNRYE